MANHLLESGERIRVVHNWGSDNIKPRPTEDHPLRNAWGWHDKFVVLYSGNIGLAHEFDTILEAADRLRSNRHILFAFVGDGPRMAATKAVGTPAAASRRSGDTGSGRPRPPRPAAGSATGRRNRRPAPRWRVGPQAAAGSAARAPRVPADAPVRQATAARRRGCCSRGRTTAARPPPGR